MTEQPGSQPTPREQIAAEVCRILSYVMPDSTNKEFSGEFNRQDLFAIADYVLAQLAAHDTAIRRQALEDAAMECRNPDNDPVGCGCRWRVRALAHGTEAGK